MTIQNQLIEIATLKEAEAKAFRNLAKVMEGSDVKAASEEAPKTTKKSAAKPLFDATPKEEVKAEAKEEVTLEQVRALLAEKSQAGLTAEVKEILTKFGAAKLSAVKPEDYASLYAAASELK